MTTDLFMRLNRFKYRVRPWLEPLESRDEPTADLAIDGRLPSDGSILWKELQVDAAGVFTAEVTPSQNSNSHFQLTLARSDFYVLTTSSGTASNHHVGQLGLHLAPGIYQIGVSGDQPDAPFHLASHVTPGVSPLEPISLSPGDYPTSVVAGDFNGDGHADIVTADHHSQQISVWLGNGDGTFQPRTKLPVSQGNPNALLVAELNNDQHPDLITANFGSSGTITVFLGDANGSFHAQPEISVLGEPVALAVGDLDGDHRLDLAVACKSDRDQSLSLFHGIGDGQFDVINLVGDSFEPSAVAISDVTGDDIGDLIWTSRQDGKLKILTGTRGTLGLSGTRAEYPIGFGPTAVTVADLNGDKLPDVITANTGGNSASILLGKADGTMETLAPIAVGRSPISIKVADLNQDSVPDLIVGNKDDVLNVILGVGDATFGNPQAVSAGSDITDAALADFNGDNLSDVITSNGAKDQIHLLFGNGLGSFLSSNSIFIGSQPNSVALGDVNRDGILDGVTANGFSDTINVVLGNGDGTFGNRQSFEVEPRLRNVLYDFTRPTLDPVSVSLADFNNDGRLDVVTGNRIDNTASVLLGYGNGSFRYLGKYPVGAGPQAVVASDIDQDGSPDFVTANADGEGESDTLTVWWGNGDGTFSNRTDLPVGNGPIAVQVADVNLDGRPDLVSANQFSDTLSVLLAKGDGKRSFDTVTLETDAGPISVVVADINNDHVPDLISGNFGKGARLTSSIFLGNKTHTFFRQADIFAGTSYGLIVDDLNNDGLQDIAGTDIDRGLLIVSYGNGDGTFGDQIHYPAGASPIFLAKGDLDQDGNLDLVTANSGEATLGVFLGPFVNQYKSVPTTPLSSEPRSLSPLLLDLDEDGLVDIVSLDRTGNILFRKGQENSTQPFASPRILNDQSDARPRPLARDIVAYNLGGGHMALAVIEVGGLTHATFTGQPTYTVSKYVIAASGEVSYGPAFESADSSTSPGGKTAFTTRYLPTGIASGDLDGSGRDSLILLHGFDDRITIARPDESGTVLPLVLDTGDQPTRVTIADINADRLNDILVSASVSGDLTVLRNDPEHNFNNLSRYPLGTDLSIVNASRQVYSLRKPTGLIVGNFFKGDGPNDVAVLLQGSHELSVSRTDGHGGYLNPNLQWATPTSQNQIVSNLTGALVGGDFNRDGITDAAFLERDRGEVWVYHGTGNGAFKFIDSIPVGVNPEGLTAFLNPTTNREDLFVGNAFGDVLRLEGKANGTFQSPPPLTGRQTSLSANTVRGSSVNQVMVVNQKTNTASIQTVNARGKTTTLSTLPAPDAKTQQAPRDGLLVSLNNGPSPDMIVVGAASNDVVIYRSVEPDANGAPKFAPPDHYTVGTNPVSVVAKDINDDQILDLLVTNQGSNDISILFGSLATGHWSATTGPRLRSGGIAPVGVNLLDLDGDHRPELIVTNQQSSPGATGGNMVSMTDRGFGFFNDVATQVTNLPIIPSAPPSFPGPGVMLTQDGNLFGLDPRTLAPTGILFEGGGIKDFDTLNDGRLVAFRDGGVDLLAADAAGLYHSGFELTPLTGVPSEPTALEVLETQSGLRVLVATAGSDQLFVFDLAASDGVGAGPPPESKAVSQTTVLSRDSLAVVVTLLAGGLSEDGSTDNGGVEDPVAGVADAFGGLEGVQVAAVEEAPRNDEGVADVERILPAEDAERELRKTKLYRPTEEFADPPIKTPLPANPEEPLAESGSWMDGFARAIPSLGSQETTRVSPEQRSWHEDGIESSSETLKLEHPPSASRSSTDVAVSVAWLGIFLTLWLQPSLAGSKRQSPLTAPLVTGSV